MKKLGLAIKKGELWHSVLEGDCINNASIVEIDKNIFPVDTEITELMNYFYNLYSEIITKHQPTSVAIKISLDANLDQIPYLHCSVGVLGYLCHEKKLPLTTRSSLWASSKKRDKCQLKFPDYKFNKDKLYATVVALHEFKEKNES